MSGTLPFIEDSTGEKFKRQKYKEQSFVELKERGSRDTKEHTPTTALSYDEVNDDLDELVALRGEGRYFGVTDPDDESGISRQSLGPLCANCHKRGHTRAKCTVVICHKCGAIDDHYESQCPTTIICSRCGEKGHIVLQCKSKIRKRQYCRTCDSFKHGDENCPSIWRSYITKLPSQGENEESSVTTVHQMSILVMNVINRDPPEYLILVVHLVETIYPKNTETFISKDSELPATVG